MQGPRCNELSRLGSSRRTVLLTAIGLCLSLGAAAAPERKGNAAAVADVAAFVTWPAAADYGLSFRLCLRDDDPAIGEFLRVRDATVQGKPLTVHSMPPEEFGRRPCHIAYFSPGYVDRTILKRLKHQPTLTISPERGFASKGGLVELNREGGRLVLVVDRAALPSHPLAFSAQLLAISHQAGE